MYKSWTGYNLFVLVYPLFNFLAHFKVAYSFHYLKTARCDLDISNCLRYLQVKLMGQLELNNSNPAEILHEASRIRKASFFQALSNLYLWPR